jgi:mannose-6-phosphate isomerase-like protein (cupin superfamily)
MLMASVDGSWRDPRGGQTSFLLLGDPRSGPATRLAITWVEAPLGSEQETHDHPDSEQVYVIIAGRGRMTIDGSGYDVESGTAILVEPGESHSIRGLSEDPPLTYVSATVPPFQVPPGRWSLPPRNESPSLADRSTTSRGVGRVSKAIANSAGD